MLPGVLAGLYTPNEMTIDLVRFCQSSGAELIIDQVVGLNESRDELQFADRPPLPFDVLSVGIGSVPSFEGVELLDESTRLLTIKPMQTLLRRFDAALDAAQQLSQNKTLNVAIVGAGAGGTELAFCLPHRIHATAPHLSAQLHLVYGTLLPGFRAGVQDRVVKQLSQRQVTLHGDQRVVRVEANSLTTNQGTRVPADLIVWVTRAAPPSLLGQLNLPTDDQGFLATTNTLKTTADANVFAVGDSGTIQSEKLPKAGVYAVRQGPILWDNIQHNLAGRALRTYHPQREFLKLLNTGDGRAIGEYHGVSFTGTWAFKWKDYIDRNFMRKFQDYSIATMSATQTDSGSSTTSANSGGELSSAMRCLGCGGKIGGSVLRRALSKVEVPASPEVAVGLAAPDDAAILKLAHHNPITVTTDFFALPIADNYLAGRIAALNALSDVWAMGARPVAALAIVVLPFGAEQAQEHVLIDLLAGGVRELRQAGASLVGGHTIEGPRTCFGFNVVADQQREPVTKSNLRAEQLLVLTKPLGSGVLLAAHMQARCSAGSMKVLERAMLTSNQPAAETALASGASAITDVTGFGLAGHLWEMLTASNISAELQLSRLPLLFGATELFRDGVVSTLATANRQIADSIDAPREVLNDARYQALFDPQTNGGMLYAIDQDRFDSPVGHHVVGRTLDSKGSHSTLFVRP
jgi:selenide,water dikinase